MRSLVIAARGSNSGVLAAIKLDRKTQYGAIKIEHVITDRMLSAKIDAKLPVAKLLPQIHFDICGVAAQSSGSGGLCARQIETRRFDPHPARYARRPPLFKGR